MGLGQLLTHALEVRYIWIQCLLEWWRMLLTMEAWLAGYIVVPKVIVVVVVKMLMFIVSL